MDEEEKEMNITKPIEATKVEFMSDQEYKKITEIIRNPAKPNEYVRGIFKSYQSSRKNND